jgi:hypothetical protein
MHLKLGNKLQLCWVIHKSEIYYRPDLHEVELWNVTEICIEIADLKTKT